jgi:hypothetical protein
MKSVGANITGRRTVSYFEQVWTSVEWKLTPGTNFKFLDGTFESHPQWALIYRLTFGLTSHDALSALWQIMPWSWFVDWFLHVSTVLDATNNTVPVTYGAICIMRHTNATALVEAKSSSADLAWCKPTGLHKQSEDRKQRLLVSPILPFAPSLMPVFTTGQWSILGALSFIRGSTFLRTKIR